MLNITLSIVGIITGCIAIEYSYLISKQFLKLMFSKDTNDKIYKPLLYKQINIIAISFIMIAAIFYIKKQ